MSYYARCRGVFFAPYMEDYGFVTMEAFRSRKPVITCMDSGGPAEIVSVGRSGYVLLPEPFQIAQQLEAIVGGPAKVQFASQTAAVGEHGRTASVGPAADVLGWRATTALRRGLEQTVAWYGARLSDYAQTH